jgi:hypothetical protein
VLITRFYTDVGAAGSLGLAGKDPLPAMAGGGAVRRHAGELRCQTSLMRVATAALSPWVKNKANEGSGEVLQPSCPRAW